MGIVHALADAAAPWQSIYADHAAVAVAVAFVHLGALLVGGGLAIAADRATLRAAAAGPGERARQLAELRDVHGPVLTALALVAASGVLLFASDVETYAVSVAFWVKMGLVALLLANGALLARAERALRARPGGDDSAALWRRLRRSAWTSATLWLAVTLAGVTLLNA